MNGSSARLAAQLLAAYSRQQAIALLLDAPYLDPPALSDALRAPIPANGGGEPAPAPYSGWCIRLLMALTGPHDAEVPFDLYGEIGAAYRTRHRPELALTFYQHALQNASAPAEKASVLNSLGCLELQEGNLKSAEDFFLRAQQMYQNNGLAGTRLAKVLLNRASIANLTQRTQDALSFLEQVLQLVPQDPDLAGKAKIMQASLAFDSGDPARARELLADVSLPDLGREDAELFHCLRERLQEGAPDAQGGRRTGPFTC